MAVTATLTSRPEAGAKAWSMNEYEMESRRNVTSWVLGSFGGLLLVALGLVAWLPENAPKRPTARAVELSPTVPKERPYLSRTRIPSNAPAAPSSAPPAPEPVPLIGPLSALEQSREARRALYRAEEARVAACMKERGFPYRPNDFDDESEVEGQLPHFEPGNVELAAASGYGLAEGFELGEAPLPKDANDDWLAKQSPKDREAWEHALRGDIARPPDPERPTKSDTLASLSVPDGPTLNWDRNSCLSRAQRDVYGDDYRYIELNSAVNSLMNEVSKRMTQAPKHQAALQRWRDCMRAKGLDHEQPGAASRSLLRDYKEGKLSLDALRTREIEIATIDATCDRDVGLAGIRKQSKYDAEQEVAVQNGTTLHAFEEMQTTATERARALTESRGGGT